MNLTEKARQMVENRRQQMVNETNQLKENYQDYAKSIVEGYQVRHKSQIDSGLLHSTLQALDNFTKEELINEANISANMGTSYADYGYKLISAVLPNLVANDVCTIQTLKVRKGTVWYLSYKNPAARGNAPANTKYMAAKTGIPDYVHLTDQTVYQEPIATADGTALSFTVTLAKIPVTASSVTIQAGAVTGTDNGSGGFTGSGINTGSSTINYTTGQVTIVFSSIPAASTVIKATYKFSYESNPDSNIDLIDFDFAQDSVEAIQYKLRARYSLDLAYDMQQTLGVNADDLVVATLAALIKADQDRIIMKDMYDQAGPNSTTNAINLSFDAAVPQYISVQAHYSGFLPKVITKGNNRVFERTTMFGTNYMIAGTDVCTVVESIPGFERADIPNGNFAGPHVVGKVNGHKIIKNPHYGVGDLLMGFKSPDNMLATTYIWAPYRPLYLLPQFTMDDDRARRLMATSAGKLLTNVDGFITGQVTNV